MDNDRTTRRLEIHFAIRDVLNREWDPIGVAGDWPDEYDSYIPTVYQMMQARLTPDKIAKYLAALEHDHMCLERSDARERCRRVAALLLQIDIELPPSA